MFLMEMILPGDYKPKPQRDYTHEQDWSMQYGNRRTRVDTEQKRECKEQVKEGLTLRQKL